MHKLETWLHRQMVSVYASMMIALLGGVCLAAADPWVVYQGGDGVGKGKHIVLIAGDEEYRSEEGLPQLGKILARRHGFKCTVLFPIHTQSGMIDPKTNNNIPGLEALRSADLMILLLRFRDLPDEQMRFIVDYLEAGKPVMGLRTATHAFLIPEGKKYSRYSDSSKEEGWVGGFGQRILGQKWVNHHGLHAKQSARGLIAPGAEGDPVVKGCEDVWGPSDVYTIRLPLPDDSRPLLLGQVLEGMLPNDKPLAGPKNNPMMPVAWTKTYRGSRGEQGRVFTTTMGAANDLLSEGLRRLVVNAVYWCLGMESKIPLRANVDLVGDYQPSNFGFGAFRQGLKPSDFDWK
jgi:type 1 glutamine amidotransferase